MDSLFVYGKNEGHKCLVLKGYSNSGTNTLEHLEDSIINDGAKGGRNAIAFLKSLQKMLVGNSSKKVNVTVKWDGAPA